MFWACVGEAGLSCGDFSMCFNCVVCVGTLGCSALTAHPNPLSALLRPPPPRPPAQLCHSREETGRLTSLLAGRRVLGEGPRAAAKSRVDYGGRGRPANGLTRLAPGIRVQEPGRQWGRYCSQGRTGSSLGCSLVSRSGA